MPRVANLLLAPLLVSTARAGWERGFSFASEGWAHPNASYASSWVNGSLSALASTGTSHIRLITTAYVSSPSSATVFTRSSSPSPLRTSTLDELRTAITLAQSLNFTVTLAPILDIDWDNASNARCWFDSNSVSRSQIGRDFNSSEQWDAFFDSYAAWLLPLAALANDTRVATFQVGDELSSVFLQLESMRALIDAVRGVYDGRLTASAAGSVINAITWWDDVDVIGHSAYWPLGGLQPIGVPITPAAAAAGWDAPMAMLANLSSVYGGKQVVITSVGYQSRPNCHVTPWGTGEAGQGNDQGDVSAWPVAYDLMCQANAYEGMFRALTPQSWFAGVYLWKWSADPTQGGSCDNDFTPHGKPAEVVLKKWYGAASQQQCGVTQSVYGEHFLDAGDERRGAWVPLSSDASAAAADAVCDGSAAVLDAMSAATLSETPALQQLTTVHDGDAVKYRGWVLGGPDEWSSPLYRLDSAGAALSLSNMASMGGNALELVVQWFFTSIDNTTMYPITDMTSPMPTSTDAEIVAYVARAHALRLQVVLSPMLDPDWTLPAQFGCRDMSGKDCYWRGQVGIHWNSSDCSDGSNWGQWHAAYSAFIMHYATLAASMNISGMIIAHELESACAVCPDRWLALLTAVRAVFKGDVSVALGGDIINAPPAENAWLSLLDWVGFECYIGSNHTAHPSLPWQDADVAAVEAGIRAAAAGVANLSAHTNRSIVCTEVGWLSAPWASEVGWGTLLDPSDSSVFSQDVNGPAHALAYTAFWNVMSSFPWFKGVFFWFWRADPTAGSFSDNSPIPWSKETTAAIRNMWAAGSSARA